MNGKWIDEVLEKHKDRILYIRKAIEFNDSETIKLFFNKDLDENEKNEVLKKIWELEEKKKENKQKNELVEIFKNVIEEGTLNIEKNIDKLNKKQIDYILSNFNNPLLEPFLPSSTEQKQALREKLLFKNLSFENNIENIQEIMKSITSKPNLYHFIAEHIAKNYYKRLVYDEFEDVFYTFTEFGWVDITELDIKKAIKQILRDEYTIKNSNEILANLKVLVPEASFLAPPLSYIPLKNGVYSMEKNKLLPYTPDLFFKQKSILPIFYNPNASCPEIEKFILEITDNEQTAKLLFQIIAYTLHRANPLQKAFFLVGSGANGKSTYINLIRAFLGEHNVSNIPFQNLEKNRFSLANLYGKYANLFADLPKESLTSVSFFKTLTGEDSISAEKKFVQKTIDFKNFAKLIFSANQFPKVYDDNQAFFRRLIVVQFSKTFIGQNADNQKLQKITSQEELSGLFNVCVKILPDILENGFLYDKSVEEVRKEYIMKSNSVAYFIEEMIEEDPANKLEASELYTKYVEFCEKKSISAETIQFFGRHFIQECMEAGILTKKKRKASGIIFEGVKIKDAPTFQSSLDQQTVL